MPKPDGEEWENSVDRRESRVLDVIDSVTFHGSTVAEVVTEFQAVIDNYLADCKAMERVPDKPAPTAC